MGRIIRYQLRDSQHSLFFFLSLSFLLRFTSDLPNFVTLFRVLTRTKPTAYRRWKMNLSQLTPFLAIVLTSSCGLIASEKNSLGNNKRSDSDAVGRIPKCKVFGEYGDYYCTEENAGCSADMIQNIGDIQPIAIGVDGFGHIIKD